MEDAVTPRRLHITEKLLSMLGKLVIADDSGQVLYECDSDWTWPGESWVLTRAAIPVASSRRKIFALRPTWHVATPDGPLVLRRHPWSWHRRVSVQGGPYDGAELTGNLLDLTFALTHHGRVLARARGKLLSLRDRHDIDVLDPGAELLTVILMANVMIARRVRQTGQTDALPGQMAESGNQGGA